jgi:hypothetical protein
MLPETTNPRLLRAQDQLGNNFGKEGGLAPLALWLHQGKVTTISGKEGGLAPIGAKLRLKKKKR